MHALLAVAGAIDALLFLHAGGLLAVYMTGNTSKLGQSVTRLDGRAAAPLALVIGCFLVASTLSAWVGARAGRRRAAVLLAGCALLAAAAQLSSATSYSLATIVLIAAATGILNQILPGEAGVTFITGSLVALGRAIAEGRAARALGLALRWLAFFAGAVLATAADERLHLPVLGVIAGALATAAVLVPPRAGE